MEELTKTKNHLRIPVSSMENRSWHLLTGSLKHYSFGCFLDFKFIENSSSFSVH